MNETISDAIGGLIFISIMVSLFLYLYNAKKMEEETARIAIEHGYVQKIVHNEKIWVKRRADETNTSAIR